MSGAAKRDCSERRLNHQARQANNAATKATDDVTDNATIRPVTRCVLLLWTGTNGCKDGDGDILADGVGNILTPVTDDDAAGVDEKVPSDGIGDDDDV